MALFERLFERVKKQMKTALFFFVHPIVNIPPPINFGAHLGSRGFKVLLVGYKTNETSKIESLPNGAKIFRIELKSRAFPIKPIARLLALVEYIWVAKQILKKIKPHTVITFNDPATIILKFCADISKKIAWLLEYPEKKYSGSIIFYVLMFSSRFWKYADALVFPSKERHVLGAKTRQNTIAKKTFIIHNTPILYQDKIGQVHSNVIAGLKFLKSNKQKGKVNVIYTGAVGNRYGLTDIVKAVGNLDGVSLLIVGKKHELAVKEVGDAMASVKHKSNLLFVDQVPYLQLQLLFAHADIGHVYYYPDTLNTLFSAPGKMYEYLKGGLVILTDNNSCIKTDLERYGCGIFYTPGDIKSLMSSLSLFSSNSNLLKQMKSQSKLLFKERYNLENQVYPLVSYLEG
ncbi:MAG: hypothetical protein ABJH05_00125 [Fulvivirga sp.]